MPKKQMIKQAKKSAAKKTAPKAAPPKTKKSGKSAQPAKKKVAARITKPKPAPPRQRVAAPVTSKPAPTTTTPAPHEEISLGRPLVTQEEKLYMVFHDDYQARQVFEFLRVETIKELEQFSQQQIIHLMSKPLRMTVDRIRQRLAQFKRSLKDDEQFAADYLKGTQ